MRVKIGGVRATGNYLGILLEWESEVNGYQGQILLTQEPDGKLVIDGETLGKEFIKEVLNTLVDNAVLLP